MVINLALEKPTSMSSVYKGAVSWKAVDGKREPSKFVSDQKKHTCMATGNDRIAWWQVDLEAVYVIREVVIYPHYAPKRELHWVNLACIYAMTHTHAVICF